MSDEPAGLKALQRAITRAGDYVAIAELLRGVEQLAVGGALRPPAEPMPIVGPKP